jgi:undecaprenyl-diphosphatase
LSVFHAIILGIVQGLSEFLPISSSGHLILVPQLFGWTELTDNDSLNKTFDVALHVGTLVAVLAYFRHEVLGYVVAALHSIRVRSITTVDERLAWLLLVTAIPGAVIGALFTSVIEDNLGDPILIGVNLILFALVLQWADRLAGDRPTETFCRRDAIAMGLAQALALAPGVSRSGATISAGRWLHFDRASAAKLSFLMSIPITGGARSTRASRCSAMAASPPGSAAPSSGASSPRW